MRLLGGLIHLDYFAALVKAAFRTYAVLHPRLLAIGAYDCLRHAQGVVSAALAAACF